MQRLPIVLTLTIVTFGLLSADANAAGGLFQKWRASASHPAAVKTAPHGLRHAFPTYSRYQSVDDAYPKYIGAFHSRYFQDLGIPSGDIGIRANTLQLAPW